MTPWILLLYHNSVIIHIKWIKNAIYYDSTKISVWNKHFKVNLTKLDFHIPILRTISDCNMKALQLYYTSTQVSNGHHLKWNKDYSNKQTNKKGMS